ncbi:putative RNA-directed DNA polymerase from transposon X-element, partial [Trichonephila clavipes]
KIFRNRTECIASVQCETFNLVSEPPLGNRGTKLLNYANTFGFVIFAPADLTRIPQRQGHQPSVFDLCVSCRFNNIAVESRYDLSSDHNPVHFVVKFKFKTSYLLNCKTITNWNKFQNILTTTIAGNPPINNTAEIEDAISKLNYNIHAALNQASKFKSMKQDFTLVPYPTMMKIRGNTDFANSGNENATHP